MTTEHGVKKAVKRLVRAGFNAPDHLDDLVYEWRAILDDVDDLELGSAVGAYLKSEGRFFPRAGQLRSLVHKARAQEGSATYDDDAPSDYDAPCPVCGAELKALYPNEQVNTFWNEKNQRFEHYTVLPKGESMRYGYLHDRQKHRQAGKPAVGYWR